MFPKRRREHARRGLNTGNAMDEQNEPFDPDLSQLGQADWLQALRRIGQDNGFAEPLGKDHAALFVERGDTLLVSFERMRDVFTETPARTPLSFEMVRRNGWSVLTVLCRGDTWGRDPRVYGFFDQLLDDGFFDEFDTVLFYGAGSCGYAAAAYSVAAPGARVLMLAPQATLDPRVTEWDDRFAAERRRDFTSRYGFAPDMIDAAQHAVVLYDPRHRLDAMHSALFERRNVSRFRLPFFGGALQADLLEMDILPDLLDALAEDRLDTARFAELFRARRTHRGYLRNLLQHLEAENRIELMRMLCENVTARMHAPRFRKRLAALPEREDQD